MKTHRNGTPLSGLPKNRKSAVLTEDWLEHSESHAYRAQEHQEVLDRSRLIHDQYVSGKLGQADMIEEVELDHLRGLRQIRSDLNQEITAAHEVAAKAFAVNGLPYIPGESKVEDLYAVSALHEADAANRAGLPGVFAAGLEGIKFLKWAGMAGCLILGSIGMGALVLRLPPRQLATSILFLPIAAGLSFILIGGIYMIVHPTWRRIGTMRAAKPKDSETKLAMASGFALTMLAAIIVAAVDAKAIMAINAARAMIDPNLAPSFAVAFLVALALSAAYVLGSSVSAYHDGYGGEADRRIKAEQHRHISEATLDSRLHIEVQHACEALNSVAVMEKRRQALSDEIRKLEVELRESRDANFSDLPTRPELAGDQRSDLSVHRKRAGFAAWKLMAHEALGARTTTRKEEERS